MKKTIALFVMSLVLAVTGYAQDPPTESAVPAESSPADKAPEIKAEPATPKPGPVIKKLTADELSKIKAGKIILRSSMDEDSDSGSGYAIGLIKATPEQILNTILDYDRYVEFMPRVITCKKTLHRGNRIDADFKLDMDITKIRYSIIHTLHPSENKLTWTLDDSKPADYVTETTGYFQLEQLPEGGTLIEYSVEVDLEIKVPGVGWIVRKLTKYLTSKDLPDVIETLRKRVESGNTWKRK